jgi:hypothetical protein
MEGTREWRQLADLSEWGTAEVDPEGTFGRPESSRSIRSSLTLRSKDWRRKKPGQLVTL